MSGKATLAGFTVNHRFGFPDLPPPYVVAEVAILEDPRVRLTTNIVDGDPDALAIGQPVEVTFQQVADVVAAAVPARAGRRTAAGAARRTRSRLRISASTSGRC